MVTKILKAAGSTSSVVKYNEDKVAQGEAQLVFINNIPSESISDVYETLERYEQNPLRRNNVKQVAFHMAVNPGPEDGCSEQDVLCYIYDVMERLGYGKQPYAIYEHNDIERSHYHVASVRITEEGKTIESSFEAKRVSQIQKELASEYHFHVGVNKDKDEKLELPDKLTYGEQRWPSKALLIVQETIRNKPFLSFEELQENLLERNVGISQSVYKGKTYDRMTFYVTDDDGKKVSTLLSAENDFDVDLYAQYEKQLHKNLAEERRRQRELEKKAEKHLAEQEKKKSVKHKK